MTHCQATASPASRLPASIIAEPACRAAIEPVSSSMPLIEPIGSISRLKDFAVAREFQFILGTRSAAEFLAQRGYTLETAILILAY